MFVKIFEQIFNSSIANDYELRHFFIDLLILADAEGIVDMTPESISRITRVPIQKTLRFLEELQKPDPQSRSRDKDGARIVLLDAHRNWGWQLVNYRRYREIRSELDRSRLRTTEGAVNYGGYVYFISHVGAEEKVKIGYSKNPWSRVVELATGSPEGIIFIGQIPGGPDTETSWHEKFKEYRLNGEWFSMSEELKSAISSVVDSSLRKVVTRSSRSYCSTMQRQTQKKIQKKEKDSLYHKDSKTALHCLNEVTGKSFREVDSNLAFVSARLEEPGVTIEGVQMMIARQAKRWMGTDQADYLRPETLFNKTKFDGYYAAKDQPVHETHTRTNGKGVDRNKGTCNEGKSHLYKAKPFTPSGAVPVPDPRRSEAGGNAVGSAGVLP